MCSYNSALGGVWQARNLVELQEILKRKLLGVGGNAVEEMRIIVKIFFFILLWRFISHSFYFIRYDSARRVIGMRFSYKIYTHFCAQKKKKLRQPIIKSKKKKKYFLLFIGYNFSFFPTTIGVSIHCQKPLCFSYILYIYK